MTSFFGRMCRNPKPAQISGTSASFQPKSLSEDPGDWCDPESATLITSKLDPAGNYHAPALDLDKMNCMVLPSSTPGNFHLYIDHILTKDQYFRLLDLLGEIGILEDGFVNASKERGYSSLRKPGVKKLPC